MPRYQCVQFGSCPRADACEQIEIKSNGLFKCPRKDPSCRQQLVELRSEPGLRIALISLPVAALIGLGVWLMILTMCRVPPQPTVEQLLTDVWPWLK